MRIGNIGMLNDTLRICGQGHYFINGKKVDLKLSREEMKSAQVFLPEQIAALKDYKDFSHVCVIGRCGYGCVNMDAFSLARKRYQDYSYLSFGQDSRRPWY